MSASPLPLETEPLSQIARIVDTYVAPSKTFADLLRSSAWWLPCILVLLFGVGTISYTVQKIGADGMVQGMLLHMPSMQSRIDNASKEQGAQIRTAMAKQQKNNVFTIPIGLLVGGFITAGLFLAVANFAFGGTAKYKQLLAVFWYSQLPLLVFDIVVLALMFANVGTENYNPINPAGTNIGYFVDGASPVLSALLNSIDIFSIWIIILQVIGVSRVAKLKTGSAAAAVLLCWILYIGVFKVLPMVIFG